MLGYDSVIAHVDEFEESRTGEAGWGKRVKELFRAKSSRVWPPAEVQELVDLKSNYLLRAQEKGVSIAPTHVYTPDPDAVMDPSALAKLLLDAVEARGWDKFVVKPVPSTWSVGVQMFTTLEVSRNAGPFEAYLSTSLCKNAWEILVQAFMPGLAEHPEARGFFYGGDFLYAVGNSRHKQNTPVVDDAAAGTDSNPTPAPPPESMEVTDCCESASDSMRSTRRGRRLPEEYWGPARELGRRMHSLEVLPAKLTGFNGQELSATPFPWVVRCDVGFRTGSREETDEEGKRVCFLNEIEICTPTLYLAKKFGHAEDFLAMFAQVITQKSAEAGTCCLISTLMLTYMCPCFILPLPEDG
jgi:hypothetical protein